jgi:hypothetical protein
MFDSVGSITPLHPLTPPKVAPALTCHLQATGSTNAFDCVNWNAIERLIVGAGQQLRITLAPQPLTGRLGPFVSHEDRVPGSRVTETSRMRLAAKEVGHRGSWLRLSLRRLDRNWENNNDQTYYRIGSTR